MPLPRRTFWQVLLIVVCSPATFASDVGDSPAGVYEANFDDGQLDDWNVDPKERATRPPLALEITPQQGNPALHFKGDFQNRVFLGDRPFRDFSLSVRMKKTAGSYAGVVVRDHWRVYFQMKSFLSLNSDAKDLASAGEQFKSAESFPGERQLTIICAGPLLHAFVDNQRVFTRKISDLEGRVGFYAHGGGEAYYDDLRIDPRVASEYFLLVEPETEDGCLVYPPDEPVGLRFRVTNFSDQRQSVTVSAGVKTWQDDVITGETTQELEVEPRSHGIVQFAAGSMAAGVYRVHLRATAGEKEFCTIDDLPLAIQQRGSETFAAPIIPIAAYYKYYNRKSPIYTRTYAHAAGRSLQDAHFTAVVADPSFTPEIIDIFQSYGIATIARGQFLDHPAVIATLSGDEPKPDEVEHVKQSYARLREATDKPITTCLVGDALGLGRIGGPLWIWNELQPDLRCFRWYGVKKSFYGILHEVKYKPYLPLSSVLRIAESSSDTPYWFVAPSLGKTDHEAYYHKPTPAEIRGMMHLAMAYGADGILFFGYQDHGSWTCFVDQRSLQPGDGCFSAASAVAAKIQAHAPLLNSFQHVGLDIRCPSPVVDAVPRGNEGDDTRYVYVVNKDTRNPVTTQLLLWAERWTLTKVRDVYGGERLPIQRDDEGYLRIPITLAPGEGRLLATDAQGK
jgi:hypothetical protein